MFSVCGGPIMLGGGSLGGRKTPQLCIEGSNTPLKSCMLANTGSLSWLEEVIRLVYVTVNQGAII